MKISGELIKINGNPGVMPENKQKKWYPQHGGKTFFWKNFAGYLFFKQFCFTRLMFTSTLTLP